MAGKATEPSEAAKLTEVLYIGKNHSYTAFGKRFDKSNAKAKVDAKTAEALIKTGKFTKPY